MEEFSYGKSGIILSILPLVMIVILLIILLIITPGLVILPLALLMGLPARPMMDYVNFIFLFVGCIFGLSLLLTGINQYNTIRVVKNGLEITTLGPFLFWKFVHWENVIGVELSSRLDRWRQPIWMIKVKKLTLWHYFLSKLYNLESGSVILATSDLKSRQRLLEIITKNCSGERKNLP